VNAPPLDPFNGLTPSQCLRCDRGQHRPCVRLPTCQAGIRSPNGINKRALRRAERRAERRAARDGAGDESDAGLSPAELALVVAAEQATEQALAELVATREELSKAAAAEMDAAIWHADPPCRRAAKERATALHAEHDKKLAALRLAQREMLEALRVAHNEETAVLQHESVTSLAAVKSALAASEEETEVLRRRAAKSDGAMATAGYHIDQAIGNMLRPFGVIGDVMSSAFGWKPPKMQEEGEYTVAELLTYSSESSEILKEPVAEASTESCPYQIAATKRWPSPNLSEIWSSTTFSVP